MVESRQSGDPPLVDVTYAPQRGHRGLPVEVIDRSSILARDAPRTSNHRQRVGFHLLMVCTAGRGTHVVDFEAIDMSPGACLRVHPGQVQRFVPVPVFDAHVVVWPTDTHPADPTAPPWYPGCGAATSWHLAGEVRSTILSGIEELRVEQGRFDGGARRRALMTSLLHTLLLRLAIEVPDTTPDTGQLPEAYLRLRRRIEQRLHERPSVTQLAQDLGYSARTLDRACRQATGRTAKQVLDERVGLEIRRLLTHTDRPVSQIAVDLGFDDPSNFSKFVRRQLGALPTQVRDRGE